MRGDLPAGTVTFLFTDVEGSTRLLDELGTDAYAEALAEHRCVLRAAFEARGGVEVDTQGDAFFVAFPTAPDALAAAAEAREQLESGPIRVRIGIHTGTPLLTEEGYVGVDVHRAARIAACGRGGQVLVSSSTAALAGTDGLRDLGLHRLKDLSAPERIYQLGADEFSPLKSLHQTNLPIPVTPFLGREKELGEVLGLISRGDVRLLTLTGPGGTGKTRLGAQAAGAVAERYSNGVWWIPLAALRDPALVVETAAQTLGAQDGLADHIGDKSMLLLFDNFEQVVDAASDLAGLLKSCPNLDLLVTSREPLHVTGEQEYAVPPLVHEEGVGFFLARARSIDPTFQADEDVSEICRRLDDLPLALELAAARVKALSSEQILGRLEQRLPLLTGGARDLPERQRTLRATIEWSYELLTAEERRLFTRLAVFRGGCTLEVAEQVASADVDTLQSLVDKSLVRHTRDRYGMLETIREYAAERLEEPGGRGESERRHAEFFLALGQEADKHLRGDPKEWLDRLNPEHDNFRAAFDRFMAAGDTQLALALGGSLQRFWYLRGHYPEARRRLDAALAADGRPTAARAYALNGATMFTAEGGDIAAARAYAEEALAINERLGDAWGTAVSLFLLAQVIRDERDFATAHEMYEDCARRFEALGDDHYVLLALFHVAWMVGELGDPERERKLHEDNLRRARATSNKRIESVTLYNLARFERFDGRFREAIVMTDEAYQIVRELDEPVDIADSVSRFASMLAHAGKADSAVRVLSCSEALREELGARRTWVLERNEETLGIVRSELDEAAFAEAWEQGRKMTPDEAVALAREAANGL
jgi:predicted ATPase